MSRLSVDFQRWFALLGGGVAWTLHLLSAYAIAEFGCLSGLGDWLGIPVIIWLIAGITLPLLALSAVATLVGMRYERRHGTHEHAALEADDPGVSLVRYGIVANALFILTILAQTVPLVFFLRGC